MMSSAIILRMSFGGLLPLFGIVTVLQVGGAASAAEQQHDNSIALPCEIEPGSNAEHAEQDAMRKSHLVTGEVTQMDGEKFVIKDKNGKEVRFQLTKTTEKPPIEQGDVISVSLDKQNRALWIRGNRSTDRRAEHVSADCNPTEDVSSEALKQSGKSADKKR